MSGWNGFANLDLSGVQPDDYAPLSPGEYEVRCTDAVVKTGGNNINKRVVATLVDTKGSGSINAGFNVVHSTSKQAVEIGMAQLKSFLMAAGHPTPDRPGDIASLKGLTCRVYVGMGKPYIGQDGRERTNPEVKRFIMPDAPDAKTVAYEAQKPHSQKFDDDIPF